MYSGYSEYKLRNHKNIHIRRIFNRLSKLRDNIYGFVANIINFILSLLPTRLLAMIKHKIAIYVKMPYPLRVIIDIDSYKEIGRAGFCFREPHTVTWAEECAKKGGILYDIGANIGAVSLIYTVNHQEHHGEIRKPIVFSFEPSFSTFNKLCKNIYANNWGGSILPFSFPISQDFQKDKFKFSSIEIGTSGHQLTGDIQFSNLSSLEMPVLTLSLDFICFNLNYPTPDWLKIDVDGHDYNVLLGAQKLLKTKSIKSILIEKNANANDITTLLTKAGYKLNTQHPKDDLNLRFDI